MIRSKQPKKILFTFLIPCLNEVNTIGEVIKEADKAGKKSGYKYEILVADNGSTDGSIEVLKKQNITRIIDVPVRGYGAALHYGILDAKGEYVLFADADLSYRFNEFSKFLPFINSNYDLILGSRIKGNIETKAMPLLNRYLGTPILTFLIRYLYGIKTSDCNSGMRLIKRTFYLNLGMKNAGMEWASELLIRTAIHKGKYTEVPISFNKDKRENKPHLLRWSDGWRHLKAIILLKPLIIFIAAIIVILLSLIIYRWSGFKGLFFLMSGVTLMFTYLTAVILNHIANNQDKERHILLRFSNPGLVIVGYGILIVLAIFGMSLINKIIYLSIISIYTLWVFFVETIKTHLINTLPNEKINVRSRVG